MSHVLDKSNVDHGASAPARLSGNPVEVPEGLAAKLKDIISKAAMRGNYSAEPQPEVEPNVDEVGADGASEETDSDDLGVSINEIDSSQTVSSFTQTPATPEAVQRMKDLYFAVMRLRKDKNKKYVPNDLYFAVMRLRKDKNKKYVPNIIVFRPYPVSDLFPTFLFFSFVKRFSCFFNTRDEVLFENAFCKATVKQVAEFFRVGGMLNTAVAAVGIFLLHSKYQNSSKMVAPFHISQSIWKGSFDNRHLIRFFSAYADEPLDKKDIVLFGVFDPPATREGAGHYCVVALNIKHRRFELLDSWHLPGTESGIRVINRMAKNIKQLWRNGSSERKKKKLDPANIDHFRLQHAVVPQQENPTDCGFFMNELLETYD
uniref:Ubiquitin-like protease family profile domain-containing protein n=2 Tax=Aegilops tauschii subsp. strangulata TaxID=200361 RepID=A0A453BGK1_AEGTS